MTLDHLRAVQESLEVAQEALNDAIRVRDQAVRDARADGIPVPAIADALGVGRQMVYRILGR